MKAEVMLLVATGRVLIMPKYQPTNPEIGEEDDLILTEETIEEIMLRVENSSSLVFLEHHLDCWS